MKLQHKVTLLIVLVLIIDQILKIWIKTHMTIGQSYSILGDRGFIYFVENNGMAFGMQFFGPAGKLLLTLFRLVFIGVLIWFVRQQIRYGASVGLILALGLVIAGAAGNLIDSMFYGVLFGHSDFTTVAQFLPAGGGYESFMFGKVVDMFYFPVIQTVWPSWMPSVGGQELVFFRPIFNIADIAITCSVFYVLVFKRKELGMALEGKKKAKN